MIRLSEAEWKVMTLLWQDAPQTMMQLTKHFKDTTGWSKHTVMTFLRRMEEKKAIYHVEGTRAKQLLLQGQHVIPGYNVAFKN